MSAESLEKQIVLCWFAFSCLVQSLCYRQSRIQNLESVKSESNILENWNQEKEEVSKRVMPNSQGHLYSTWRFGGYRDTQRFICSKCEISQIRFVSFVGFIYGHSHNYGF